MEKPTFNPKDSREDSFSPGNGSPACNQQPKGANDSWSVPVGVPEPTDSQD